MRHIIGLKFFNVYGPYEEHKLEMRSFISQAYNQFRTKNKVELYKSNNSEIPNGHQKRDFVYIDDVVDVIFHFINTSKNVSNIYNVGSSVSTTFLDLVKLVYKYMNTSSNAKLSYKPMNKKLSDHYQNFTQADLTKLRKEGLYINSFTSIEVGIEKYIRFLDDYYNKQRI